MNSISNVWASPNSKGDFYISGFETIQAPGSSSPADQNQIYEFSLYKGSGTSEVPTSNESKNPKTKTVKAVSVTTEENTNGFRKTLESFQSAITGLCISHLELSLAFNVSAKAWVIVTGEVAGSVKVILKNPNEKCPKSRS